MNRIEIETIAELTRFLAQTERDWRGVVLQGITLAGTALDSQVQGECLQPSTSFLGCSLSPDLAAKASSAGCLIIPKRSGLPYEPFRGGCYSKDDLLSGYDRHQADASYRRTPDWLSYESAMDENTRLKRTDLGVDDVMFHRLHDLAVEDALYEYLKPETGPAKKVVGIMGGHDRERLEKKKDNQGNPTAVDAPYMQVALLAWKLARQGFCIATGGGPGAMEAGNIGAWFAARTEEELRAAVRLLQRVPKVQPVSPTSPRWNSGEWLDPAFEVMETYPRDKANPLTESVGIPTWFFGHEPPNPFATHIAKYFENSLREEGLLAIASHGVVFAEGNGGTVQEIFQDACQNYYKTYGPAAPMVLIGRSYWDRDSIPSNPDPKAKPAWPLLQQLGKEKQFGHLLCLTDSVDEAVNFIANPPSPPPSLA